MDRASPVTRSFGTPPPSVRTWHARGARWIGEDSDLVLSLTNGAFDWFRPEGDDRATQVKQGKGRSTWRVHGQPIEIFAKVCEPAGVLELLKWRILGSPTEREWRAARSAFERGVPTVHAFACGRQRQRCGRAALLTERWKESESLIDAWRSKIVALDPERRRARGQFVVTALARLFALAHRRGVLHRDAHPSNILVRISESFAEAAFVDLLGASISRGTVSRGRQVAALARLDHAMRRVVTRTERFRFLHEYLIVLNDTTDPCEQHGKPIRNPIPNDRAAFRRHLRTTILAIVDEEKRHTPRLAKQRDRRLRRKGPYFATLAFDGGWRATVALKIGRRQVFPEPGVSDRTLEWWKSNLPSMLERCTAPLSNAARSSQKPFTDPPRTVPLPGGPCIEFADLHFESFHPQDVSARIRWTTLGSPARHAFEQAHRSRHRDLPAPLILGFAERRKCGLTDAALLITPRL